MRIPTIAAVLALSLLVMACNGDSASERTPAPAATATPSEGAAPNPTATTGDSDGPLPEIAFERVFPNVTINEPTGLYQAPDGRWFATDQTGRILVFADSAQATATEVLDITGRVNDGGNEEGLLGFAFAPDFETNGVFYVNYTATGPRRTVISRFTFDGTRANPAGEQVILEVEQPFSNHNGGQIAFGPDGYLYIAIGDGGSGNDPQGNGQNLGTLLGSILRIDVSRAANGLNYAIPSDNPFVGQPNARGEVWAYGLRNPWRFSFDTATGDLWAGDVGQNAREEIDLITRGGNYGWAVMEGAQCLGGGNCDRTGLILPVVDYARASGRCSVTGGFVYRGEDVPDLRGAYIYGDYCSGEVWAIRYDGEEVTQDALIGDLGAPLSSFAQGRDGEIYALAYGEGAVYRLVAE